MWDVFVAALKLGLTSFGGPVAHIGYFREEYVTRRKWLDDRTFADLTALCQFLPGPASSQLGMAIGMRRAGTAGAVAAWIGFTLPSALLMALFAIGLGTAGGEVADAGWLHGLKLVAVAIVAQAVWSMGRSLASDRPRATMALAAACWAVLVPGPAGQLIPLVLCAAAGLAFLKPAAGEGTSGGERAPAP
ncbi:chromate transporter [Paenibacillus darwinianus]